MTVIELLCFTYYRAVYPPSITNSESICNSLKFNKNDV